MLRREVMGDNNRLAQQICAPLEILANTLYLLENSSAGCDLQLLSGANKALNEILILVKDHL